MTEISGSFSVGRVAHAHNKRETLKENISAEYSYQNCTLRDKLQGARTEDYINQKMQPVIDAYNRGKKPSRQIKTDYLTYREQNKLLKGSPVEYEAVIQIGEHATLGKIWKKVLEGGDAHQIDLVRSAYIRSYTAILEKFEERYPHLDIVAATVHFDELSGTPHMHIDYIPFGEPEKGLPLQVSIGRALTNDGIERVQSRQEALELGGYQVTRLYRQAQEEIIKPEIHHFMRTLLPKVQYQIKLPAPGKKHELQDIWIATQRAKEELETYEVATEEVRAAYKSASQDLQQVKERVEGYKGLEELIKRTIRLLKQLSLKNERKPRFGEFEAHMDKGISFRLAGKHDASLQELGAAIDIAKEESYEGIEDIDFD